MRTEVILLGGDGRAAAALRPLHPAVCGDPRRWEEVFGRRAMESTWIVPSGSLLPGLLRLIEEAPLGPPRGRLLLPEPADPGLLAALAAAFDRVLAGPEVLLGWEDLAGALGSRDPEDLCIAARRLPRHGALVLWRGDLRPMLVSLEDARGRSPGRPDPRRLGLDDGGQTIVLGDFEVAFDALLYERDPGFRRRARRRMHSADRTFGGSLRRLRLQRGLRQGDFPGLAAKTVARIERGEILRPQARTLAVLASALGVAAEDLGGY